MHKQFIRLTAFTLKKTRSTSIFFTRRKSFNHCDFNADDCGDNESQNINTDEIAY